MKQITSKLIVILSTIFILLLTSLIYTFLLYTNKINNMSDAVYKTTTFIGIIIFFIFGLLLTFVTKKRKLLLTFLIVLFFLIILIILKKLSYGYFDKIYFIKYSLYLVSSLLGSIFSNILKRKNSH